jgi:voltage-gated potassium channel
MWRQLPNGRVVHRLEPVVLAFALLVVPVVVLEYAAPDAGGAWATAASAANWTIWGVFLVELVFVVSFAPAKRAALRAHWLDVAIVVLTPPFLPTVLAGLRLLRLARLARITRLLRLLLVGGRALATERVLASRQSFRYAAIATVFIVVVCGASMAAVDSKDYPNIWRGLWWAVNTVTTLGIDPPTTVAGRVVGALLAIVGVVFLAVLTATVAATFLANDEQIRRASGSDEGIEVADALRRIEARLEQLERRLAPADKP